MESSLAKFRETSAGGKATALVPLERAWVDVASLRCSGSPWQRQTRRNEPSAR